MKPYGCLCFCDVIASRGHNGWSRQRNLNSYSSSFLFIFFTETKEKKENRVFYLHIWFSLIEFHLVQSQIDEMWISLFFPSLLSYIHIHVSYTCISWVKKSRKMSSVFDCTIPLFSPIVCCKKACGMNAVIFVWSFFSTLVFIMIHGKLSNNHIQSVVSVI